MSEAATTTAAKPIWVDLGTRDTGGARAFYSGLFGWKAEANPDPQYGGYALASLGEKAVAGIGPLQGPEQPSAWNVYIGTADAEATGRAVESAGGKVHAPAFDVGPQGRMAVFQDPSGAFISVWQPGLMKGSDLWGQPGSASWCELAAHGIDRAVPFYQQVFGWSTKVSDMGGGRSYTEWTLDGHSIAGGMDVTGMIPDEVPSYWLVYFQVDDLDASFRKAGDLGATPMIEPSPFPGGRFAVLRDPQGAAFGIISSS